MFVGASNTTQNFVRDLYGSLYLQSVEVQGEVQGMSVLCFDGSGNTVTSGSSALTVYFDHVKAIGFNGSVF